MALRKLNPNTPGDNGSALTQALNEGNLLSGSIFSGAHNVDINFPLVVTPIPITSVSLKQGIFVHSTTVNSSQVQIILPSYIPAVHIEATDVMQILRDSGGAGEARGQLMRNGVFEQDTGVSTQWGSNGLNGTMTVTGFAANVVSGDIIEFAIFQEGGSAGDYRLDFSQPAVANTSRIPAHVVTLKAYPVLNGTWN